MSDGDGGFRHRDVSEVYTLIDTMNGRIADLQQNYANLQKNFQVLNDSHFTLEKKFAVLEGQINLTCAIVKYFITPGTAIIIILQVGAALGVVK